MNDLTKPELKLGIARKGKSATVAHPWSRDVEGPLLRLKRLKDRAVKVDGLGALWLDSQTPLLVH
jgi:hypothetical protein